MNAPALPAPLGDVPLSDVPLSDDERAKLASVADLFITRSSGMPSASDARVHSEFIDRVFGVRPDLLHAVRTGLRQIKPPLPGTFEELSDRGLPGLRALADAVTAAYFLNPDVARLVGYQKRSVIPIRFDDDLDGLVAPVSARGPIYRPTPREDS
ncbi:MAG: hypothetical protein EPO52_00265 [Herbiconiux sp.]|uniref:hypothetical protein n=1 Tax=Herbiconiux sp. TaxID=1871186 RepID=UPI00120C00B3|nr:hypothetical protein [Herbiconiux sp.]TAJ50291.1 MAG: hypothetical protein EPO52_00265 [Herbiconiux sp.]